MKKEIALTQWERDSRRQSLKGGQVFKGVEIEDQENVWDELWSKICKLSYELYQVKSP